MEEPETGWVVLGEGVECALWKEEEHHLPVTRDMAQHSLLHGSLVLHFRTILDREFIATKEGCPGSLGKARAV